MEKFVEKNEKGKGLPYFLEYHFRDKDHFLRKIKSVQKLTKNTDSETKPEDLIGRKAENLSLEERRMFVQEIEKATSEIEKKRREVYDHWNSEAERSGFDGGSEYSDKGFKSTGSGEELRKSLKEN